MRRALRHKCLSDERTLGAVQNWTWPSLVLQWDPNNPEHRAEGHGEFQLPPRYSQACCKHTVQENHPQPRKTIRCPQGSPEFAELQEEGAALCFSALFCCLLTLLQ